MAHKIISDLHRVWSFVHERSGVPLSSAMKNLGLERDGELVCGVLYDGWNGVNMWMHVAIEPGSMLTRQFVRYVFYYPFVEIGCKRLTGWVEASNAAAIRFDEHVGFKLETRLAGAASDGGDALIYAMRREECRYLGTDARMARSAAELEDA